VNLLVRPAAAPDLPEVGAVHHRSRSAAYAGLVSAAALAAGSPAAMAHWWAERWHYERDTHRLAVADRDGVVVGFSYAGPSPSVEAVELYAVHVDPSWQGTGAGRALMAGALADLRAVGGGAANRAVLWVLTGNARARRFYERGGWAADGATRRAPIGSARVPQVRYGRSL